MKNEKSDVELWADYIRDMPVTCVHCRAKHKKEDIQHIEVYPGRNEPVCNKYCAAEFAKREVTTHKTFVEILEKRVLELSKECEK